MKEFNLEEAINGKAFVLKNGYRGVIEYSVDNNIMNNGSVHKFPYIGYVLTKSGHLYIPATGWSSDGENREVQELDAVGMLEEPKISIEDLPKPFYPEENEEYWVISPGYKEPQEYFARNLNHYSIQYGNCFRTEADAQKWLDFMKSMME